MVEPGQREYHSVKSHLNYVNEALLFVMSLLLWCHCALCTFILIALFHSGTDEISLLLMMVFNMEQHEMNQIFYIILSLSVFIIIYFLLRIFVNRRGELND